MDGNEFNQQGTTFWQQAKENTQNTLLLDPEIKSSGGIAIWVVAASTLLDKVRKRPWFFKDGFMVKDVQ